jgi:hypothetical protein
MRARFPAGPPLLQEPGAGTDQPPRAWPPGQRIAIGGGPDAGRAGQTLAQIAHVAERAVDARPLPHDLGRDALREILCWRDVCAGEACPRAGVGMDGGEIGPEIGAAIGPEIGLVAGGGCWSERGDLNSRPPVPQTGALTRLRYAPIRGSFAPARARGQPGWHKPRKEGDLIEPRRAERGKCSAPRAISRAGRRSAGAAGGRGRRRTWSWRRAGERARRA